MKSKLFIVIAGLIMAVLACGPASTPAAPDAVTLPPVPPSGGESTENTGGQPDDPAEGNQSEGGSGGETNPPASTGGAAFSEVIQFALDANSTPQRTFAEGTKEVFAIWDYSGMGEDMTLKREWYLNGELWLLREEPWDFAKYGSDGTVRDVSIFDYNVGLSPGDYELRLYLNGDPQYGSDRADITFRINGRAVGNTYHASPDGKSLVYAEGGRLMLETASGVTELVKEAEIDSFDWFPDSQRVVYVAVDRSNENSGGPPSTNIIYRAYMLEIDGSSRTQLNSDDEQLRWPQVSLDGNTIAFFEGSGYGDACGVDSQIVFMTVSRDSGRVGYFDWYNDFTWPDGSDVGGRYPVSQPGLWLTGEWWSGSEFEVGVAYTCPIDTDPSGIYRFNVANFTAEKRAELSDEPGY